MLKISSDTTPITVQKLLNESLETESRHIQIDHALYCSI